VSSIVETRYGRVQGYESEGIHVFRGMRYAAAPDGLRRFMPPAPPEPWTGTRETTRYGPSAPQLAVPGFGWINASNEPRSEDCLSLNLWTPGLDGARRPVLVWIHGGGFVVGSSATPMYDGRDLAQRGDLVVVSINYRLGALGYTHLKLIFGSEFEESSNLGVRDQIAALEWLREHIDRFGGDPDNVTVFGQSAGAMSVGALLGAPRARYLFRRAICQSGAAENVLPGEDARTVARDFMEELGGPPASPAALARIPVRRILQAQQATMGRLTNLVRMMAFTPAVDGDVIPEPPLEAIHRGATAHISLLVGTTLDEWKLFRLVDQGPTPMREAELEERFANVLHALPQAPGGGTAVREYRAAMEARSGGRGRPRAGAVWSAFQSARVFHVPAARLAEAQAEGGGRSHAYLFTWRPPNVRRAFGAFHALDIPFVFGSTGHPLARPLTGVSASASRLSRKMQHAWIRFAREGEPGHERLPGWETYDAYTRATMILGRQCGVDHAPLEAERSLLESWSRRPERRRALRMPQTG
jgi:para-nitrobenzyl esterase